MKNLDTNRAAALKDMRKTLTEIGEAQNRIEIYRLAEVLSSQAFYLRDMVAHTIARRGVLYPENDWPFYRAAVKEEHANQQAS